MIRLEDLKRGVRIMGVLPQVAVTVVDVHWIGATDVELTYKEPNGQVANQLLYRDCEPALVLVAAPVVVGGALVVPEGLVAHLAGECQKEPEVFARETRRVEALAIWAWSKLTGMRQLAVACVVPCSASPILA